jgi:hypothetical protein
MRESSNRIVSLPAASSRDVLTSILREGAQRLLIEAVEAEVAESTSLCDQLPASGSLGPWTSSALTRVAPSRSLAPRGISGSHTAFFEGAAEPSPVTSVRATFRVCLEGT